jgi:hypothetical protein
VQISQSDATKYKVIFSENDLFFLLPMNIENITSKLTVSVCFKLFSNFF